MTFRYSLSFKSLGSVWFFKCFWSVLCLRLHLFDQKYSNCFFFLHITILKNIFYLNIFKIVIYSRDVKLNFQHHYFCVFSVTCSFRNQSNMMICCSRNISYYYQWLCCFHIFFKIKFKRAAFIWNIIFNFFLFLRSKGISILYTPKLLSNVNIY